MNTQQLAVLGICIALTIGLYFIPIKPSANQILERSRALEMETTDESALLQEAKEKYSVTELAEIQSYLEMLQSSPKDEEKIAWLEKLSGSWYRLKEPALAGIYAERIAEIKNDEESWAITGTTYASGIRQYSEQKQKKFCFGRAVKALENAISINPEETQHRINLALCYVSLPLKDQPMKGVLMLRDLLDKNPEDIGVLTQLGSLAIQTGQYDKAIERLEKANSIEPNNKTVLFYLVNAYKGKGDMNKSAEYERMLNTIQQK